MKSNEKDHVSRASFDRQITGANYRRAECDNWPDREHPASTASCNRYVPCGEEYEIDDDLRTPALPLAARSRLDSTRCPCWFGLMSDYRSARRLDGRERPARTRIRSTRRPPIQNLVTQINASRTGELSRMSIIRDGGGAARARAVVRTTGSACWT